jgi:hypothetical protein
VHLRECLIDIAFAADDVVVGVRDDLRLQPVFRAAPFPAQHKPAHVQITEERRQGEPCGTPRPLKYLEISVHGIIIPDETRGESARG